MKNFDLKEARAFSTEVIRGKIVEARQELLNLNQEKTLGKLKNFRLIEHKRRQIAKLMTILDEKVSEQVK